MRDSVGVQFHQPLAFLHIGFSPGYVFRVLRIRQHHLDAMLLEPAPRHRSITLDADQQ